jgi:hypothetical protein
MAAARVPIFYTRVGRMNSAGHLRVAMKTYKTAIICHATELVYGPKRIFANGPAV